YILELFVDQIRIARNVEVHGQREKVERIGIRDRLCDPRVGGRWWRLDALADGCQKVDDLEHKLNQDVLRRFRFIRRLGGLHGRTDRDGNVHLGQLVIDNLELAQIGEGEFLQG